MAENKSYLKREINRFSMTLVVLTIVFQLICVTVCSFVFVQQSNTTREAVISVVSATLKQERDELSKIHTSLRGNPDLIPCIKTGNETNKLNVAESIYYIQNFTGGVIYAVTFDKDGNQNDISPNISFQKRDIINNIYNKYLDKNNSNVSDISYCFFELPDNSFREIYIASFSDIYEHNYIDIRNDKVGKLCIIKQINTDAVLFENHTLDNSDIKLGDNIGNEITFLSRCSERQFRSSAIQINETRIIGTNWYISGTVRDAVSTDYIMLLIFVTFAETILLIVILVLYIRRIARNIIMPILEINDYIRNIALPNVYKPLNISANKDIEYLVSEINSMVLRNKKLANNALLNQEKMFEYEMQKKEITMYALRNQVNPHFLYNIFELIRSIAVCYDVTELETIAVNLSQIMRYNLKSGEDKVVIKDELEIIKKYLEIMYIRYGDTYSINYHIQDGIENELIPRMIIQPLIENCFNHGYYRGENKFSIDISVNAVGSEMRIEVADNGIGIDAPELKRIKENLGNKISIDKKNIGLVNINNRLKMMYEDRYRMDIMSEKDKYTKVVITIVRN